MPHKNKEERSAYMREYRQRIKEVDSLDGDALEDKLKEYQEQGLTKDDLFMDTVYRLAMEGKNAKYAELWWRMTRPEPDKSSAAEFTADDYINIGTRVRDTLEKEYQEGTGSCPICHRPNPKLSSTNH